MKLNPAAVLFWVFWALVGYLIGGTTGAVWGAVVSITFTTLLMFL
jgi:hypothetical protein